LLGRRARKAEEVQIEEQRVRPRPAWSSLHIPPFPQIAVRVLQLAANERTPMREFGELINSDPAFSGEVLTISNSALYARRTPVTSVTEAISVLGTQCLKGLCLTIGVRKYLGATRGYDSLRSIWRHSLATALIAERLALVGLMNKDAAYTAGIMHDIGRLAMAVIQPADYVELLETHRGSVLSALVAERELFGFDHCEAGRRLIATWKLPSDFEGIVSQHHIARRKGDPWQLVDLINVSCRMADATGFAVFSGCETVPYGDLLEELPARERAKFCAEPAKLAAEVRGKIEALEAL
jgi:putative nucleotidyltransferase with HDIG domain